MFFYSNRIKTKGLLRCITISRPAKNADGIILFYLYTKGQSLNKVDTKANLQTPTMLTVPAIKN